MNYDFLVVGAGPAGIQAAICLEEKNANYLVLERSSKINNHFRNYPRHRQLISINKRFTGSENPDFNLRHDWNSLLTTNPQQTLFTAYSTDLYPSADSLCQYLDDVVKSHGLQIKTDQCVHNISKLEDGTFKVTTESNTYTCKHLLIATGGKPWYPEINGIHHPKVDTYERVSLNKEEFEQKKILILGKGNSAFECAEYLSDAAAVIHLVSPRQISFAWNTRYVGDLRAIRNNTLDLYQLKSQFAILNATIKNISYSEQAEKKFVVDFEFTLTPEDPNNTMAYDAVIACTGFSYLNENMFDANSIQLEADPRPILKGKFPLITTEWQYAHVPNMYAIGAIMQTVNFKKNAGGFIHGFRYSVKTLIDLIFHRDYGHTLRSSALQNVDEVRTELLRRVNTSSSLYQMYSELCDVVVPDTEFKTFTYYYDLPITFARNYFRGASIICLTFSIASRTTDQDAFSYIPVATPATPELSVFIHPHFKAIGDDGAEDNLHLLENIDIEWSDQNLHIKPLTEFLSTHLKPSKVHV